MKPNVKVVSSLTTETRMSLPESNPKFFTSCYCQLMLLLERRIMDVSVILALVFAAAIGAYLLYVRSKTPKPVQEQPRVQVVERRAAQQQQQEEQNIEEEGNRANRRGLGRLRNRQQQNDVPREPDYVRPDGNTSSLRSHSLTNADEPAEEEEDTSGLGKKRAAKLAMKEEKRQQREAMEYEREQRRKDEEKAFEARKAKEAEEAEEERKKEEEIERQKKLREQQEEEEYQQMRKEMEVLGEGTQVSDQAEREARMGEFVEYIWKNKVVLLSDLASEFNMKVAEVIEQINKLETEGKLNGVTDDRGKYIAITKEEMDKVAVYIKRRGRTLTCLLYASAVCASTILRCVRVSCFPGPAVWSSPHTTTDRGEEEPWSAPQRTIESRAVFAHHVGFLRGGP
ncbi:hypothetical protein PROFUN_14223 [Planoprotostelium fungivorum]|uniref:DDRGK domain-containing protein 1 n=1 Tax=Planoprotostelium fungivorum TaxID=1890364 RepID=A0A2P6N0Q4_9EUKA|nr:hypothetical protein PROFUN_14223 [Planoprotostelium fungivorum]